MLNIRILKIKNTREVIWLNKSYGELKSIKGHTSTDYELAEESSSETKLSKLSKSKGDKSSKKGNSSSNNSSTNKYSNLNIQVTSHIVLAKKILQQAKDDLVREMNKMHIIKSAALTMQDILPNGTWWAERTQIISTQKHLTKLGTTKTKTNAMNDATQFKKRSTT